MTDNKPECQSDERKTSERCAEADESTSVSELPSPDELDSVLGEDDHALSPEELQYPEFVFAEGDISSDGGFDLRTQLSYDGMADWLDDLNNGLTTHDIAVETPDGYVSFGVGPKDVRMQFEPDDTSRGELEITFTLDAKTMFVADDPDQSKVGARGDCGFIPLSMLTSDRETFRCYNWIDDPTDP